MDNNPRVKGYQCRPIKGAKHVWVDIHVNATDIEWKVNPFKTFEKEED